MFRIVSPIPGGEERVSYDKYLCQVSDHDAARKETLASTLVDLQVSRTSVNDRYSRYYDLHPKGDTSYIFLTECFASHLCLGAP